MTFEPQKEVGPWRPWCIFFIGIFFYCFAYLLRVYPGIYGDAIRSHLRISEASFGLLAAMYYFAYAPMQVPVGVLVDRIGPRMSLILACFVAISGGAFFALSDHVGVAMVGRFLVGLGTAFAYVTGLKLAAMWLPKKWFATATGMVTAFGMIAAATSYNMTNGSGSIVSSMSAGVYLRTMLMPVWVGLAVLVLIILFVRNRHTAQSADNESSAVSFSQLWGFLKSIVTHRQVWLIGIIGCFLYVPSSVFLDLYAKQYLTQVEGLSSAQVGHAILLMFLGWIISSIVVGNVSDRLRQRKLPLVLASIFSCFFASVLVFVPGLSVVEIYCVMFLFGVSCGPHPLCFTMAKENFPVQVAGTAISFANCLVMMGGFLFQPLVGSLIQWHHKVSVVTAHASYTAQDYHFALSFMPLVLLLSFCMTFFLKETG